MKTLLFLLLLVQSNGVFICDSPFARVYHQNANCKGLEKCSHKIVEISLEKAQSIRVACKICVRKKN